jgi:hypothetical protein
MVIFLFAGLASFMTANSLHDLDTNKTIHAGAIAWRCLSFISCSHEQIFDRIYRLSVQYFVAETITLIATYICVYYIFRFKHLLKSSTDISDSELE